MPEYFIQAGKGRPTETYLGSTPNENGDYPLKAPHYGVMSQSFESTPDGVILRVTNQAFLGLEQTRGVPLTVDGKGIIRLTSHHALLVDLGEDPNAVVRRASASQ